jgi:hypothetical protein
MPRSIPDNDIYTVRYETEQDEWIYKAKSRRRFGYVFLQFHGLAIITRRAAVAQSV